MKTIVLDSLGKTSLRFLQSSMKLNNNQNFRNLINLSIFSFGVLLIFIYKFSKNEEIR